MMEQNILHGFIFFEYPFDTFSLLADSVAETYPAIMHRYLTDIAHYKDLESN